MKALVIRIREATDLLSKIAAARGKEELTTPTRLQHLAYEYLGGNVGGGFALAPVLERFGIRPAAEWLTRPPSEDYYHDYISKEFCKEFLRTVDRRDGNALKALGLWLNPKPQLDGDKYRTALLLLKFHEFSVTARRFKEVTEYPGDTSNLRKLAKEIGYRFAPGRRGAPRKSRK